MRLPWQCPTCYAELGDKSYAAMLTCPYCGSLLIVNSKDKKFYRVPKDRGWYYFSKKDSPGYIKFGDFEEHYRYFEGRWYLLKENELYEMKSRVRESCESIVEEGKVEYLWGEFPFVAPPQSVIKTAICDDELYKVTSRIIILFFKSTKKPKDIFPELFKR